MVPRFLGPFSRVHAFCTMSFSSEDDAAVAPARGTAPAVSPPYRADVASVAAEVSDTVAPVPEAKPPSFSWQWWQQVDSW